MNLNIFTQAMGTIIGQTRLFSLGMAADLGEGKLRIQTSYHIY